MIIFEYQKDMELNNEFEKKRLFRMEMESEVTADDVIDVFYDFYWQLMATVINI